MNAEQILASAILVLVALVSIALWRRAVRTQRAIDARIVEIRAMLAELRELHAPAPPAPPPEAEPPVPEGPPDVADVEDDDARTAVYARPTLAPRGGGGR